MAIRYDWKRFRKEFGLSQKALAEMLEVTTPFMSNIESGKNHFPLERLSKLTPYFPEVNFEDYIIEEESVKVQSENDHSFNMNDPEFVKSITELMTKMLANQQKEEQIIGEGEKLVASNQASLRQDNDRLRNVIDKKNEKIEELRDEILRLRTILVENGINYNR